jgi:2-aminoadipate transaminase
VTDQKGNVDFGSPNFNQHLIATVLQLGLYEPHIQRIRDAYRRKLEAMLEAARQYLAPLEGVRWWRPSGGLYVWLTVAEHIDTSMSGDLFKAAMREGVMYVPGEYCFPRRGEPLRRNTMRLSFGVQSCEKIREGVEKLAKAIEEVA